MEGVLVTAVLLKLESIQKYIFFFSTTVLHLLDCFKSDLCVCVCEV